MSEIYHGETYDARLEKMTGWDNTNYDDRAWSSVKVVSDRKDNLIAPAGHSGSKNSRN